MNFLYFLFRSLPPLEPVVMMHSSAMRTGSPSIEMNSQPSSIVVRQLDRQMDWSWADDSLAVTATQHFLFIPVIVTVFSLFSVRFFKSEDAFTPKKRSQILVDVLEIETVKEEVHLCKSKIDLCPFVDEILNSNENFVPVIALPPRYICWLLHITSV